MWPAGSTEPQRNFLSYTNVYNVSGSATFQINPAGGNDISVRACTDNPTPYFTAYVLDVEPRSGNVNGVFIAIQTPTGTYSDVPFCLTVTC
jgi:hypothetical protein